METSTSCCYHALQHAVCVQDVFSSGLCAWPFKSAKVSVTLNSVHMQVFVQAAALGQGVDYTWNIPLSFNLNLGTELELFQDAYI